MSEFSSLSGDIRRIAQDLQRIKQGLSTGLLKDVESDISRAAGSIETIANRLMDADRELDRLRRRP